MGNPDRAQDEKQLTFYDPRVMPANGVTYATSPTGGDHAAGHLAGAYLVSVQK